MLQVARASYLGQEDRSHPQGALWRHSTKQHCRLTSTLTEHWLLSKVARVSDLGHNDRIATAKTHLGGISKSALTEHGVLTQVARASDLGRNDRIATARTHLGGILHPGDSVLGYDLEHANLVDPDLDKWLARGGSPPDVVLVSIRVSLFLKTFVVRVADYDWSLRIY